MTLTLEKVLNRIRRVERSILILITSLIILSALNLALFGIVSQNSIAEANYTALKNRTDTLESYYSALQSQNSVLTDEYERLKTEHDGVLSNFSDLQTTLNELQNHLLSVVIEEAKNITLSPGGNKTITYNLPFSGYAEINLIASGEVYMWIGSSVVAEVYYARLPPFPQTSSTITTNIPVSPHLVLYLVNVEKKEVSVELEITLVY